MHGRCRSRPARHSGGVRGGPTTHRRCVQQAHAATSRASLTDALTSAQSRFRASTRRSPTCRPSTTSTRGPLRRMYSACETSMRTPQPHSHAIRALPLRAFTLLPAHAHQEAHRAAHQAPVRASAPPQRLARCGPARSSPPCPCSLLRDVPVTLANAQLPHDAAAASRPVMFRNPP